MSNGFFRLYDSPEQYDEVHNKYFVLTTQEMRDVSAPKSRLYLSVADMDLFQDALELLVAEGIGHGRKVNKRRVMQMGYALEELKHKLQKRIDAAEKKSNG